jgi:hypothetical protein
MAESSNASVAVEEERNPGEDRSSCESRESGLGRSSEIYALRPSSTASSLIFAILLAAMCFWILSLPLFPSQDGPMHRYYVHALDSLLRHDGLYGDYQIRHPLPPYATHYAVLLLLSQVLSYNLAEKVLVCLIVLCVACGLRFSARQIGPSGEWVTLLCTPLLLAWPLMAGMFNFILGIGLALLATGFWQRLSKNGARSIAAFISVLLILTYTHPIPLLLLIMVCGLDLALSFLIGFPLRVSGAQWWREHRWQLTGFLMTLAAATVPLLDRDNSQTHSTLSQFGLHLRLLGAHFLLYGISPYNSRSYSFWINAYRLCLYVILAGCMWAAGRATLEMFRKRRVNFGSTCFVAALLLMLAVPFLPNNVNGSSHFADRLVYVLWPVAMLAASAAQVPRFTRQVMIGAAAFVGCVCTLMAAQIYIRPTAYELHKMETEPLPRGAYGTIIPGYLQGQYVRYNNQLVFDPFKWAPALAFVHQNDIVLNSPFIVQKIAPLQAAPQSQLVNTEKDTDDSPNVDLGAVPGAALPDKLEAKVVRNSSFIVYVATPEELTHGLSERLSPGAAAQYQCHTPHLWYVVCEQMKRQMAVR